MSGISRRPPNRKFEAPLDREQFVGTLLPEVQAQLAKVTPPNPRMPTRYLYAGSHNSFEVDDVR